MVSSIYTYEWYIYLERRWCWIHKSCSSFQGRFTSCKTAMLYHNDSIFHLKCDPVQFKYRFKGAEASVNYLAIILLSLGFWPTVCLNLAAIYVFSRKKTRTQIPTNILILGTCVVDFLNGFVTVPLTVAQYSLAIFYQLEVCSLYIPMLSSAQSLSWICAVMAFMSSTDRYLAVFYPYFYESRCMNNRWLYYVLCVMTCIFGIGIVLGSFQVVGFQPILYLTGSIPVIIVISYYTHLRISCAVSRVHKHVQRISVHQKYDSEEQDCTKGNTVITDITSTTKARKPTMVNKKAQRVTFIMLCVLSLSYTPYFIVILTWNIRWVKYDQHPTVHQYTWASASATLVLYRSCFNPFVYLYTMPKIRNKILHILRLKKRQVFIR